VQGSSETGHYRRIRGPPSSPAIRATSL
jgi:hypothetical protein